MEKKSTENRRIALEILMEASDESVKLSNILKNSLDKIDYMDRQDKAFISRLVRGCIESLIFCHSFHVTISDIHFVLGFVKQI